MHKTEVHQQYRDGLAPLYYFSCECGSCGTLQDTEQAAIDEAYKHLEWARKQ